MGAEPHSANPCAVRRETNSKPRDATVTGRNYGTDRDQIKMRMVRFRTLGCWPLTGAVESNADTIEKIVEEMMTTTKSERTTRVIDFDQEASMEQKKREGYF